MTEKTAEKQTSLLIPGAIKLSPKEAAMLNKVTAKRQGLDQFVQTIMQQGEARLAELMAEQKDVWTAIGKAHGVDFEKVDYALEGETLVPVAMKLR